MSRREGSGAGAGDRSSCVEIERVEAYLDGELDAAAQEALLAHLPDCARCQEALHQSVQLRDREDALRARAGQGREVVALSSARAARRRRLAAAGGVLAAVAAVAAVAALVVVAPWRQAAAPTAALALAPQRSLEARLSWPGAAAYRPYHAMRADSGRRGERLEPKAIAQLAGDCAGTAAAYLLSGEVERAAREYQEAGCGDGPDLLADRAALAVTRGEPEEALRLADQVLADHPTHAVASWNRALALRDLGLGLAAAAAFDRVAAVDAAWADEARARAEGLRAPLAAARERWERAVKLGLAMIPDGPILPLELARAVPGHSRRRFHDAVRTASTRERLDALRPLARALEEPGSDTLERALDAAARRLSSRRAALVPVYVALLRDGQLPPDAQWRAWKARARAAGATDLLLGAQYLAFGAAPETEALAAATGDPWFIGMTELDLIDARAAAGDSAGTAAHLARLEDLCASGGPRYLCLRASLKRAELSVDTNEPAAAVVAAREGLREATANGEFALRSNAAYYAALGEHLRDAFEVARGYYEESALSNGDCAHQLRAAAAIVEMAFDRHRFEEALRLLAEIPRCDASSRALLDVKADLLAAGVSAEPAWREELDAAAAAATSESDRLLLRYLTLRAQLHEDPAAAEGLLELARRARASADPMAERIRVAAETTVIVGAGRRQRWAQALAVAADAHGAAKPERCALALASDDFQLTAVAVSARGELLGDYQADVGAAHRWSAPPAFHAALEGCPAVSVLTFPPWFSADPPLRAALPWSFAMGAAAPPSTAPPRVVIVSNPTPPRELRLAPLAPLAAPTGDALVLSGATATVRRLAAEARDATLLELHAHTTKIASSDAPAIALSASPTGWSLTAEEVARWDLTGRPVVLLADCAGAQPARYDHVAWGLPAAFRRAGARAVVAALVDVPDEEGGAFFAELRQRLLRDPDVARVVADLRAEKIQRDPTSWVQHVVVFQ
ncbi:MAG: CHAT domain-containing protein [Kofleriaceae bacterium]